MDRSIRVLIVDDSAFTRQVLKQLLSTDPNLEVVGVAPDPIVAWEKIRQLRPDVLTLDVEMPRMDGLSFLRHLMRSDPMPVVMVSSLTTAGAETTLLALELGAVDFVCKPRVDVRERLPEIGREVAEKVRSAARARLRRSRGTAHGFAVVPPRTRSPLALRTSPVVAVGASTGGTEAIREFLTDLPADFPGMVIVQHMPPTFSRAFAERLDRHCSLHVKEAEDRDRVEPGKVLVAPGDYHMRLQREGGGYRVRLDQGEPVNRHRPSVDVLFSSCAETVGENAVGILLTGMGDDGARGLLDMRSAGAKTLAQDEASSVIFGMPKAAIELRAVDHVVPLGRLAPVVLGLLR